MAGPMRGHGPMAPRGGFSKPKNVKKTALRLLGYMAKGKQKLLLLLVLLCLLLSVVCNIGGTYFANVVILNNLVAGSYRTAGPLASSLAMLAGIYLLGAACSYAQSAIMAQLAQKGVNRLREELFDKLQSLPLAYFDRHTHGELMSRFTNDADNVQTALQQSLVSLFSSSLMFVGLILAMLRLNPLLFPVTALTIALSLLGFKILGGRSRTAFQAQQKSLGALNGNIQEMIEGLKVVKAFTHEEEARSGFAGLNDTYRQAATTANFYSGAMMPLSMNIMNIGYAFTAAFGGLLSVLTGFDLGSLIGYLQYTRQISQPMSQISQQMTAVLSAMAGAERIFTCMDEEPEQDQGQVTLANATKLSGHLVPAEQNSGTHCWAWKVPDGSRMTLTAVTEEEGRLIECPPETPGHLWAWKYPEGDPAAGLHRIRGAVYQGDGYVLSELTGAVRFQEVDFSYVPEKQILHHISVYANPGQKIAFVGSTGAGKTTVTNLINRFYEIEQGVITYGGIDIREIRKDDLRRSLGAVLQDTHLFTGSVMENIRYGRLDATDAECIHAAKTAGAHSFIRRLPEGYDTLITGDGANLSQGQRQLLGIARCAVADPPVMILDEATSSIDTRTERLIQQGMDALMEGRTVFVIAHRLSTVRNADAIIVIENGRVEERGSHDQLLEQQGRYYRLYTGQFALD